MSDRFASSVGMGFVELLDATKYNGSHYVRAAYIVAVRPVWNEDEYWIGCDVYTVDGSIRRVNASFEQIMKALSDAEGRA